MHKQRMTTAILLLAIIYPALTTAEFYKWVDEHGRVHYGDKPTSNNKAKRVTARDNSLATPNTTTTTTTTTAPKLKKSQTYTPNINDIRSHRAQMHSDMRRNMQQKIQQGQDDYKKKVEQDKKRNEELAKFSQRLAKKQRERDAAVTGIHLNAAQRLKGTNVLCRKNPKHPNCKSIHIAPPKVRLTEEEKTQIKQTENKYRKEINMEFMKYPTK